MTPTYVTFEQAKLLNNEIRNKKKCYLYKDGSEVTDQFIYDKFDGNIPAPMDVAKSVWSNSFIERPEQWQVVEWLRLNHNIWVSVNIHFDDTWYFEISKNSNKIYLDWKYLQTPQEAYSAAFDYILNNLI
jgi:hypothetical protein